MIFPIEINYRSDGGKDFFNFVSIPYAKPPIGKLRLRKPKPIEPWTETLQAKEYVKCLQVQNTIKFRAIERFKRCSHYEFAFTHYYAQKI